MEYGKTSNDERKVRILINNGRLTTAQTLNTYTMERKIVKTEFEITTTASGKVFAKVGDTITISNRDSEYYNVYKVNDTKIFSRWMRKAWVNAKCK